MFAPAQAIVGQIKSAAQQKAMDFAKSLLTSALMPVTEDKPPMPPRDAFGKVNAGAAALAHSSNSVGQKEKAKTAPAGGSAGGGSSGGKGGGSNGTSGSADGGGGGPHRRPLEAPMCGGGLGEPPSDSEGFRNPVADSDGTLAHRSGSGQGDGRFSPGGEFRSDRPHDGIDIVGPEGSPVEASRGGTISHVGELEGYGPTVEIDHGDGTTDVYAHLDGQNLPRRGDKVQQGELIGNIGLPPKVPNTDQPHLHFEVIPTGSRPGPATQRYDPTVAVRGTSDLECDTPPNPDTGNQCRR